MLIALSAVVAVCSPARAAGTGVHLARTLPFASGTVTIDQARHLAYAGNGSDSRLAVVREPDDRMVVRRRGPCCGVYELAHDDVRRVLYTEGIDTGLSVVDDQTGVRHAVRLPEDIIGIAVDDRAGRVYASGGYTGTVYVLDAMTRRVLAAVPGVGGVDLALDPVRHRLYASAQDALVVVDTTIPGVVGRVPVPGLGTYGFGLALDEQHQLVYTAAPGGVAVVDVHGSRVMRVIGLRPGHYRGALAVDPGAARLYVSDGGSLDGSQSGQDVDVLDTTTDRMTRSVRVGLYPRDLDVDTTNHRVYVACGYHLAVLVPE